MMAQDIFLPIIVAIAGCLFGGTVGSMLPCGFMRADPARPNYFDFEMSIDITRILFCIAGFVIGSVLNLFLYYIGMSLVHLLIVGFVLAALSSLICPKESRWGVIKAIALFLPFNLFRYYVLLPIRKAFHH